MAELPTPGPTSPTPARIDRDKVIRGVVAVVLVVMLVAAVTHIELVAAGLQWIDSIGPLGDLLFAVFYLLGTVAMLPGSILEGGAGFLYGAAWGIPIAVVLGTACSAVTFLLGRTLLRGLVEKRIAANPRWSAVDRRIGVDGFRLVFLLRLSPLAPFNFLSAVLGATPVSLKDFVLGTALGHLFPVCVFVTAGSTVASAFDLVGGPHIPGWVTALVIGVTVIATIGVSRFAQRALEEALSAAPR